MAAIATKQLLRKEIKLKVSMLSDSDKVRQSNIVAQKLLNSDIWKASRRVSMFASMSDEINTMEIMKSAFLDNKECFIPRYIGPNMDMLKVRSWQDFESLPETKWKIKQPAADDSSRDSALETGGLDLVLVPGLAFTRSGDRLGRGKGYYDRFLSQCHQLSETTGHPLKTVALAFSEQIVDHIPTTENDVRIDMVLFAD